jgi:hypothetical protein
MTSMTLRERRGRVEAAASLLGRVRWLLERTHSRLIVLGDIDTARTVNRLITYVDTERGRWLHTVGSTHL